MEKKITVSDLCRCLKNQKFKVLGSANRLISHAAAIDRGGEGSLSFCSQQAKNPRNLIKNSKSSVIVCPDSLKFRKDDYRGKTLILVKNPRLFFIRLVKLSFSGRPDYGIHPTAIVDPRAKIHPDVYIGPHVCVGKCEIGQGAIIYGNVHVYSDIKIGKRVTIHAGTVIGADGFGYERAPSGKLEKFPHFGGVVIEDDVEIGSNTSIDRGTLKNTVIGKGTKIDNLVHIAHNAVIGKHCAIIAHAMIGGSVRIGDYSWIAPSACIRDGIKIGKRATVGLGAVVTKDISAGLTVMGCPAKPIEDYKKIMKIINQMAESSEE